MNLTKIIDESVQAVLTEKKDLTEYISAGGEQVLKKVKEGAEGVNKKIGGAIEGAEGVGKKVVGAIKSEPVAASTAAAIAAGLGAVALAKKLRKAKKTAKAKA